MSQFHGAKAALFAPEGLVVLRRDDIPTIPWPDRVDLPGGGREGEETPLDCARRETREELGLDVPKERFFWSRGYEVKGRVSWLLAARVTSEDVAGICFGDEGQGWWVDPLDVYLSREDAISHHQMRVLDCLKEAMPEEKVACGTPNNPGKTRIPAWKFHHLRRAILETVSAAGHDGVPFRDLPAMVAAELPCEIRDDLGSLGWHTTTVKLELEVRKELAKLDKPGPQRLIVS